MNKRNFVFLACLVMIATMTSGVFGGMTPLMGRRNGRLSKSTTDHVVHAAGGQRLKWRVRGQEHLTRRAIGTPFANVLQERIADRGCQRCVDCVLSANLRDRN